MSDGAYADQLQVAIRATNDFRFDQSAPPGEEEAGVFVGDGLTWDEESLRSEIRPVVSAFQVQRMTTTHREVSAGADGASLQILVEAATDGTVGLLLGGLVAAVRSQVRRRQGDKQELRAAEFTDHDFERTAKSAIQFRHGDLKYTDLRVTSLERGVDGRGTVEVSLPEGDGRFVVDVQLYRDGLRAYNLKRVYGTS